MDKLKPCPFCGGKAVVTSRKTYEQEIYSAYCTYIFCIGFVLRFGGFITKEKAIEAWNRRADDADI